MEYPDGIHTFVNRTRDNLEVIRAIKRGESPNRKVWEFTQLINSMLGLLVFPQQEYLESIPKIPLDKLREDGWRIPKVADGFCDPEDLQQLFRKLRNSVAHFNIEFIVEDQQLSGLTIWNTDPNTGVTNWLAEISKEDLEDLTNRFVNLLLD